MDHADTDFDEFEHINDNPFSTGGGFGPLDNPFATDHHSSNKAWQLEEMAAGGCGRGGTMTHFKDVLLSEDVSNVSGLFVAGEDLHKLQRFINLKVVSIDQATEKQVKENSGILSSVEHVILRFSSPVSPETIEQVVAASASLRVLSVPTEHITAEHMIPLSKTFETRDLLELFAGNTEIDAVSAGEFAFRVVGCRLPRLSDFENSSTKIKKIVAEQTVFAFVPPRDVNNFRLDRNYIPPLTSIDDTNAKVIASHMPKLREVNLSNCAGNISITNAGLTSLVSSGCIVVLDLSDCAGCSITSEGITSAVQNNPQMRILRCCNSALNRDGLKAVATLSSLEELDVSFCDELEEDDLNLVYTGCKQLKKLNVVGVGSLSIFTNVLMDFYGLEIYFTNSVGDKECQVMEM